MPCRQIIQRQCGTQTYSGLPNFRSCPGNIRSCNNYAVYRKCYSFFDEPLLAAGGIGCSGKAITHTPRSETKDVDAGDQNGIGRKIFPQYGRSKSTPSRPQTRRNPNDMPEAEEPIVSKTPKTVSEAANKPKLRSKASSIDRQNTHESNHQPNHQANHQANHQSNELIEKIMSSCVCLTALDVTPQKVVSPEELPMVESKKSAHKERQKKKGKKPHKKPAVGQGEEQSLDNAVDSTQYPDQEYLQFSLRITEDIIRNDLYSHEEMKRVFNSHIEANRGRLNMEKMLEQIDDLCRELGIPFYDPNAEILSSVGQPDNTKAVVETNNVFSNLSASIPLSYKIEVCSCSNCSRRSCLLNKPALTCDCERNCDNTCFKFEEATKAVDYGDTSLCQPCPFSKTTKVCNLIEQVRNSSNSLKNSLRSPSETSNEGDADSKLDGNLEAVEEVTEPTTSNENIKDEAFSDDGKKPKAGRKRKKRKLITSDSEKTSDKGKSNVKGIVCINDESVKIPNTEVVLLTRDASQQTIILFDENNAEETECLMIKGPVYLPKYSLGNNVLEILKDRSRSPSKNKTSSKRSSSTSDAKSQSNKENEDCDNETCKTFDEMETNSEKETSVKDTDTENTSKCSAGSKNSKKSANKKKKTEVEDVKSTENKSIKSIDSSAKESVNDEKQDFENFFDTKDNIIDETNDDNNALEESSLQNEDETLKPCHCRASEGENDSAEGSGVIIVPKTGNDIFSIEIKQNNGNKKVSKDQEEKTSLDSSDKSKEEDSVLDLEDESNEIVNEMIEGLESLDEKLDNENTENDDKLYFITEEEEKQFKELDTISDFFKQTYTNVSRSSGFEVAKESISKSREQEFALPLMPEREGDIMLNPANLQRGKLLPFIVPLKGFSYDSPRPPVIPKHPPELSIPPFISGMTGQRPHGYITVTVNGPNGLEQVIYGIMEAASPYSINMTAYDQPINRNERTFSAAMMSAERGLNNFASTKSSNFEDTVKMYEKTLDLTPEKENNDFMKNRMTTTILKVGAKPSMMSEDEKQNLLLGSDYDINLSETSTLTYQGDSLPYPLSSFYPTTATQVSSNEIGKILATDKIMVRSANRPQQIYVPKQQLSYESSSSDSMDDLLQNVVPFPTAIAATSPPPRQPVNLQPITPQPIIPQPIIPQPITPQSITLQPKKLSLSPSTSLEHAAQTNEPQKVLSNKRDDSNVFQYKVSQASFASLNHKSSSRFRSLISFSAPEELADERQSTVNSTKDGERSILKPNFSNVSNAMNKYVQPISSDDDANVQIKTDEHVDYDKQSDSSSDSSSDRDLLNSRSTGPLNSIDRILEKLNEVKDLEETYSMTAQVAVVTKKMEGFREFGDIQEHALKEVLEEQLDDGTTIPFDMIPVEREMVKKLPQDVNKTKSDLSFQRTSKNNNVKQLLRENLGRDNATIERH